MKNPFIECPVFTTESFTIRLVAKEDYKDLYECYHDVKSVELMNDDNCDFGFYVESEEQMLNTIGYWIDFYQKGYFIRFSIIDNKNNKAIGTIEGFGGETGVLRIDIKQDYEKEDYIKEILSIVKDNFYKLFQNEVVVTKAIIEAEERRAALEDCGWEFIDEYRDYRDYYKIVLK